jgi:hippurate hydrolase
VISRENNPFDPAVITVGSFQGGSKHNIIPDVVNLQLTVRSYKPEVRQRLLDGIERIAKAEALAGRSPKEPDMKVVESTKATYNDPELAKRLNAVFAAALGPENLTSPPMELGAEDFSEYVQAGVPGAFIWVGAVERSKFEAWKEGKAELPSTHSPLFAPDRMRTLKTGVLAETLAALELLTPK